MSGTKEEVLSRSGTTGRPILPFMLLSEEITVSDRKETHMTRRKISAPVVFFLSIIAQILPKNLHRTLAL